jgi:hypothetical protein
MQLPQYITVAEVQRVCRELSLRDWTELTEAVVEEAEAARIQQEVGGEALLVLTDDFRKGLEVELEHGLHFSDTNVTNNHPILTGKIVAAHLKESLDYYRRLEIAELEGDLLKAIKANDPDKAAKKYRLLAAARQALAQQELSQLQ